MKTSRRKFIRTGAFGVLAFVAGDKIRWLTPVQARAEKIPFQSLDWEQAKVVDRLGDLIVPGAAAAGLSHFLDQQLSASIEDCMLVIRYLGVEAPYKGFYAQSLAALEASSQTQFKKAFAHLSAGQVNSLVDSMAKGNPPGWQGPPAPFFFFVLRNDASDVVYGTEKGFANLGIPYMAHISPSSPW